MTDYVFAGRVGRLSSRESTAERRLVARVGGEGDVLVDAFHRERCYQGDVSFFHVAAVTLPVNANNLVSVCGIYNPPGSGKILEIIDTDVTSDDATTVVQAIVWVSSTVALSAAATFTTAGTARSRRMQDPSGSVARVYTAVTHSGTPNVEAVVGGFGATTSAGMMMHKKFDGTLMIPPGVLASVASLTAASTATGLNVGFTWADIAL